MVVFPYRKWRKQANLQIINAIKTIKAQLQPTSPNNPLELIEETKEKSEFFSQYIPQLNNLMQAGIKKETQLLEYQIEELKLSGEEKPKQNYINNKIEYLKQKCKDCNFYTYVNKLDTLQESFKLS